MLSRESWACLRTASAGVCRQIDADPDLSDFDRRGQRFVAPLVTAAVLAPFLVCWEFGRFALRAGW